MTKLTIIIFCLIIGGAFSIHAEEPFEKDTIPTSAGDVEITFIGHGTIMVECNDKIIHIDPYSNLADYSTLPDADMLLLTHHHSDHLDKDALNHVLTDSTTVIFTEMCADQLEHDGIIMENGDTQTIDGIKIHAIPAYNLVHKRDNGDFYHPKGEGNGYILTIGDTRIYIAGDTENTPEMKALKDIDYTFLPMNLPYTMSPEMVADAARAFKPKVLYPYHYGNTDTSTLIELLKDEPDIEIRIRDMQ